LRRGSSFRFLLLSALPARTAGELLPRPLAGFPLLPVVAPGPQPDGALPLRRLAGLLPQPGGELLRQPDVGPLPPPAGEHVQPQFAGLPLPRGVEPLLRI